ncbi:hypothetical protein ISR94_03640 [Candidatus Microgenomates bacterium]|nr:hypothetical protein [Candidatus Microgenomates bacterium]
MKNVNLRTIKINFAKKIIFGFIAFLIAITSVLTLPTQALAQNSTWYNQNFEDWFVKVYDTDSSPPNEIFGERYTAAQVQWIVYSLATLPFMAGSDLSARVMSCAFTKDFIECGGVIKEFIDQTLELGQGSGTTKFGQVFSTNPISGVNYVSTAIKKFKFVPEAQAQGFGYNASDLAKELWAISRNFAYALTVLVVIVFAFMIMFRVKISPQVVISVQSALPKIIGGVVLVTFSYAIAGFAIDLMYVVLGLLSSLLIQGGLSDHDFTTLFNSFVNKNVFWTLMQYWIMFIGSSLAALKVWFFLGGSLVIMFWVVMLFILLFMSLKIIFMMLKTFIRIFFLIILGPLQILLGVFTPNMGFGAWLKSLMSNLAVYPIVAMMFFFAFFFLRQSFPDWDWVSSVFPFDVTFKTGGESWKPPFTFGTSNNPISGGVDILFVGISFMIVTLIPKTVEIIQGLMSGKPFAYGTALGEAAAPVKGYGQYAGNKMANTGNLPFPISNIYSRHSSTPPNAANVKAFGETLRALMGR